MLFTGDNGGEQLSNIRENGDQEEAGSNPRKLVRQKLKISWKSEEPNWKMKFPKNIFKKFQKNVCSESATNLESNL
jgi:hypothetical protein